MKNALMSKYKRTPVLPSKMFVRTMLIVQFLHGHYTGCDTVHSCMFRVCTVDSGMCRLCTVGSCMYRVCTVNSFMCRVCTVNSCVYKVCQFLPILYTVQGVPIISCTRCDSSCLYRVWQFLHVQSVTVLACTGCANSCMYRVCQLFHVQGVPILACTRCANSCLYCTLCRVCQFLHLQGVTLLACTGCDNSCMYCTGCDSFCTGTWYKVFTVQIYKYTAQRTVQIYVSKTLDFKN